MPVQEKLATVALINKSFASVSPLKVTYESLFKHVAPTKVGLLNSLYSELRKLLEFAEL